MGTCYTEICLYTDINRETGTLMSMKTNGYTAYTEIDLYTDVSRDTSIH